MLARAPLSRPCDSAQSLSSATTSPIGRVAALSDKGSPLTLTSSLEASHLFAQESRGVVFWSELESAAQSVGLARRRSFGGGGACIEPSGLIRTTLAGIGKGGIDLSVAVSAVMSGGCPLSHIPNMPSSSSGLSENSYSSLGTELKVGRVIKLSCSSPSRFCIAS